jgi:hypothetical protein
MANTKVQSEQIEDGSITADKIADGAIVATELADNAVTTAKINADAVTGAKIADDAIDSEHYTDGSIDTAHIANAQITVAKMAANSVDSDQYVDGSIDTVHLGDLQVTTAKIANGNISTAKIADNAVTSAKIDTNIDIAGTFDVTGATTLDAGLTVDTTTLVVDATNNRVGIGTASPNELLEVDGNIKLGDGGDRSIIAPTNSSLKILANPNATTEGIIFSTDGGTTNEFFIQDGGNIGINQDTPTTKLNIVGAKYVLTDSGKATGGIHIQSTPASSLDEYGGAISFAAGNVGSAAIAAVNDGGSDSDSVGLAFITHGSATSSADAIEVARFDETGNFGIGTTSPIHELHVASSHPVIALQDTDSTEPLSTYIDFLDSGDNSHGYVGYGSSSSDLLQMANRYDDIVMYTGSSGSISERMRITDTGIKVSDNHYVTIGDDSGDAFNSNAYLRIQDNTDAYIQIKAGASNDSGILLGDVDDDFVGGMIYLHSDNALKFYANNTAYAEIFNDGYTSVSKDSSLNSGKAGLQVEHGGLLINGTAAAGTDAIGSSNHHSNYWTFFGSSGRSGTRTGSFRIEVPEPSNGATNHGYGSFSVEIYISGYNGAYCHAVVSGYNNNGINISESTIIRSSGSHTLTYGVLSGTANGFYVDIDIPSYTHSSAYYRITKGGDTSANHDTDFRNVKAIFT